MEERGTRGEARGTGRSDERGKVRHGDRQERQAGGMEGKEKPGWKTRTGKRESREEKRRHTGQTKV